MRPFRRRASSAEPAPTAAGAADSGAVDSGAPLIARTAGARPEWRDVPAMGRSFGPPDLTVGIDSFRSGLASHTAPHGFLAPLAHLVSADGPSGIVTGLAQPIATVSRSVTRVDGGPLPVRQARPASRSSAVVQRWPARTGWGAPMVTASSVEVPPLAFDAVETPTVADPQLVSWDPEPAEEPAANGHHPVAKGRHPVAEPPSPTTTFAGRRQSETPSDPPPAPEAEPPAAPTFHAAPDVTTPGVQRSSDPAVTQPTATAPADPWWNSYLPGAYFTEEPPRPTPAPSVAPRRLGPVLFGPGSAVDTGDLGGDRAPGVPAEVSPADRSGPLPPAASRHAPIEADAAPTVFRSAVPTPRREAPVGPRAVDPAPAVPVEPPGAAADGQVLSAGNRTATATATGDPPGPTADPVLLSPVGGTETPLVTRSATTPTVAHRTSTAPRLGADLPEGTTALASEPAPGPAAREREVRSRDLAAELGPGRTAGGGSATADPVRTPVVARSAAPDVRADRPALDGRDPAAPPVTAPLVGRPMASDRRADPPAGAASGGATAPVSAPARWAPPTGSDTQGALTSPPVVARTVAFERGVPSPDPLVAPRNGPTASPGPSAPAVGRNFVPAPVVARSTRGFRADAPAGDTTGPGPGTVAEPLLGEPAAPDLDVTGPAHDPSEPGLETVTPPLFGNQRDVGAPADDPSPAGEVESAPLLGSSAAPGRDLIAPGPGAEVVTAPLLGPPAEPGQPVDGPGPGAGTVTTPLLGSSAAPGRDLIAPGPGAEVVTAPLLGPPAQPGQPVDRPRPGAGIVTGPILGRHRDVDARGGGPSVPTANPLVIQRVDATRDFGPRFPGSGDAKAAAPTPGVVRTASLDRPPPSADTPPTTGPRVDAARGSGQPTPGGGGAAAHAPAPVVVREASLVRPRSSAGPPDVGTSAEPTAPLVGGTSVAAADPFTIPRVGGEVGQRPDLSPKLTMTVPTVSRAPNHAGSATAPLLGGSESPGRIATGRADSLPPSVATANEAPAGPPGAPAVSRSIDPIGRTSAAAATWNPLASRSAASAPDATIDTSRPDRDTGTAAGPMPKPIPAVARRARSDAVPSTRLVGSQPLGTVTHEPTAHEPTVQRAEDEPRDHSPWPPRSGLGQPLPAGAAVLQPPPATPATTRRPSPMPVVQQSSAEPGSSEHARNVMAAALAAGGTTAPDGSIVFAGTPAQPSSPTVQRSTVSDPPPSSATPPVTRAATGTTTTSSTDEDDDRASANLDLLASQLYDRVLFRLRRDLRHELERKGQHVHLRRS